MPTTPRMQPLWCVWHYGARPPNDNGRDTLSLIRPTAHSLGTSNKEQKQRHNPSSCNAANCTVRSDRTTVVPKHTANLGRSGSCPRIAVGEPKVCPTLLNPTSSLACLILSTPEHGCRTLLPSAPECRTLADALLPCSKLWFCLCVLKQFVLDHRAPVSDVVKFLGASTSSSYAINLSLSNLACAATKAGCWPRAKSRSIKGSPCSLPSPRWMRWATPQSSSHRRGGGPVEHQHERNRSLLGTLRSSWSIAFLDMGSNAPTPSIEVIVVAGFRSLRACSAGAMHSHPARVESAH